MSYKRPETLYLHERGAEFLAERNARIFHECKKYVCDILRAIRPSPMLPINIFRRAKKSGGGIRIHGNRICHRNDGVVPIVAREKIPKDARVFRNDVPLPIASFVKLLNRQRNVVSED